MELKFIPFKNKTSIYLSFLLFVLIIFGIPFPQEFSLEAEVVKLESPDDRVRFAAISKLVDLGPEVIPYLLKYMDSANPPTLRQSIIQILGEIKSSHSFNVIKNQLNDENWRIRFFSAEALGKLNVKNAIPELKKITLYDSDNRVALRALLSLEEINEFEDLKFLKDLTKSNKHYEEYFYKEVNDMIKRIESKMPGKNG